MWFSLWLLLRFSILEKELLLWNAYWISSITCYLLQILCQFLLAHLSHLSEYNFSSTYSSLRLLQFVYLTDFVSTVFWIWHPIIVFYLTSIFLRRRLWHPTPVLVPGKSRGRRSLVCYSPLGHEESDTTERLHLHFSRSRIAEGNGNPLQCSCLENPRDGGAWWAAIYGVA